MAGNDSKKNFDACDSEEVFKDRSITENSCKNIGSQFDAGCGAFEPDRDARRKAILENGGRNYSVTVTDSDSSGSIAGTGASPVPDLSAGSDQKGRGVSSAGSAVRGGGSPTSDSPVGFDLKEQIAADVAETVAAEPEKMRRDKAKQEEENKKRDKRPLYKPKRPEGAAPLKLVYRAFRREELGISELLSYILRGKFVFDNPQKTWFKFNCTIWEEDRNRLIERQMERVALEFENEGRRLYKAATILKTQKKSFNGQRELGRKFKNKASQLRVQKNINSVVKMLRRGDLLGMDSTDLAPHRNLLPTLKTIVDLRTGKEFKSVPWPDLHFRSKSPWEYKGLNEPAEFWEQTLQKVFCHDAALIEYFEYFVGFCVSGFQPKNFFVFLGQSGDNGKSVVFETIQRGLGNFASTVKVEMLLAEKFPSADKPSPSLVGLRGVRMAVSSEAEDDQQFSAAKIKLLTSASDKIKARTLNKGDEEFSQTHCLALHTNSIPKLKGADPAFMRNRLRIFPCNARFVLDPHTEEEQPEKNLWHRLPKEEVEARLEAESSGILAWMIRCAKKAIKLGQMPPSPYSVTALTEAYGDDQDWCGQFLSECCEEDEKAQLQMKDLHKVFAIWFREQNNLGDKGKVLITPNKLGREMSKRPDVKKLSKKESRKGVPLYCGWRIKPEWTEKQEQAELSDED